MKHVGIIGGGAAGMLAALFAARAGARVTILERNEKLGKKIYITGKGRCNATNACDKEAFFKNIVRNPRFLYASFARLSNLQLLDLLESLGCPMKVERGDRAFPVSDKASDVTGALSRELRRLGVAVRFGARVESISCENGRVAGVMMEGGESLALDAVVVATGGASYPSTGSTGDGYALARAAGHTIVPCRPALVPIETKESWCAELMGLSLKNVRLSACVAGGKRFYSEMGEMLFTHFGISGPLVLTLSSLLPQELSQVRLSIDLKPALTPEQLDSRLVRDLRAEQNRAFGTLLGGLLPRSMVPVMAELCGVPPERKCHSVTREERAGLLRLLKDLPVRIAGFRPVEEAIVTAGGVALKEIDAKTMASKKLPGLFFAGEVLDLDAYTGGFNLQIAFATGQAAGRAV